MEATAEWEVASSVVTFAEVSTKLIRMAQAIYCNGPDNIPERLNAQALIDRANKSLDHVSNHCSLNNDLEMKVLIYQCRALILDIQKHVPKIESTISNRLLKTARSGHRVFELVWKKSDLDEYMKRLHQLKVEL